MATIVQWQSSSGEKTPKACQGVNSKGVLSWFFASCAAVPAYLHTTSKPHPATLTMHQAGLPPRARLC